jgi:hypothetical protein
MLYDDLFSPFSRLLHLSSSRLEDGHNYIDTSAGCWLIAEGKEKKGRRRPTDE